MSAPPPPYESAAGYPNGGYQPSGYAQPYPSAPQPQSYHPQGGYAPPPQPGFIPAMPPPVRGGGPGAGGLLVDSNETPKPNDMISDPENGDDNAWAGASFSDKAIRRSFIKKVYLILSAQLSVTVGFIAFFLLHEPTQKWVQSHSWFYWCSYGVFLVTYIALVCCPSVRRKSPGNFICLGIFTFAFSYMAGTISSYYNIESVLIATAITALVCISITIFAIQTKIDFTMCHGLLFAMVMVLFFFGMACMIVNFSVGFGTVPILRIVYAALGAIVFSLFLVYDTQMLMGGRKMELSPEEYIYAATQIYLDVVYIFLFLLSIFGSGKN